MQPPAQREDGLPHGLVGGVPDDPARLLAGAFPPGPLLGGQVLLAGDVQRGRVGDAPLLAGRGVQRPQAGDRVVARPGAQERDARLVRRDLEGARDAGLNLRVRALCRG